LLKNPRNTVLSNFIAEPAVFAEAFWAKELRRSNTV